MFANMRIDLNISRKFDLKIVNLKQKVRSLSLEMANINLIFYKIRKWSRACALTQLLRSANAQPFGKHCGPSQQHIGLSFVRWRALKCWAEEKKKKTEKETINNLIVIRVLEPKPKTDLYQRKYYVDHFHTYTVHTIDKQKYTETRSQFLDKSHLKCASSDGKSRVVYFFLRSNAFQDWRELMKSEGK